MATIGQKNRCNRCDIEFDTMDELFKHIEQVHSIRK